MSPRTIAVLSHLCIVIAQRIVVLPQVRWSPEDAGRLDASQRANRAVESTEPSQQSSLRKLAANSGRLSHFGNRMSLFLQIKIPRCIYCEPHESLSDIDAKKIHMKKILIQYGL